VRVTTRRSKAKQNEADFLEYVAARYGVMERTALALTSGNEANAQDLVQTTLIEMFTKWRRIRDTEARDSYSRTIMVRTALREQGKEKRNEPLTEVSWGGARVPGTDFEHVAAAKIDIDKYLQMLSPRQRAVVVCRYLCDLSEDETARVLGCAPGTVKSHTARALAHLRQVMTDSNRTTGPSNE
jgi:RNA polymerase sigma-70 factor (sigma-E family)